MLFIFSYVQVFFDDETDSTYECLQLAKLEDIAVDLQERGKSVRLDPVSVEVSPAMICTQS